MTEDRMDGDTSEPRQLARRLLIALHEAKRLEGPRGGYTQALEAAFDDPERGRAAFDCLVRTADAAIERVQMASRISYSRALSEALGQIEGFGDSARWRPGA